MNTDPHSRAAKPEIMSPAGYWPQLNAAIEAGADAVYFGLKHFSARAKVGFTLAELGDVMRTLHRRGVKGYLTFNTLVFDHELGDAAQTLAAVAACGVDALIVQDAGIARLAHALAPELPLHGSTQMSITSAEGVEWARSLGVTRVVLARELALSEIAAIRAQTDCELEIFVHGALCVSYSGQCFSSEAWGGRSANRGQCAQACRLPYELVVDEVIRPLADKRYLLSPGDLYALRQMPEIVQLGVSALKIEGRYKDADYVALTTAAYRQAVDEAWAGRPLSIAPAGELALEQVYSRGLGPRFLAGTNHQTVVDGRAPRHRGVLVGRVERVEGGGLLIRPEAHAAADGAAPLKPGDGLVIDAADWRSPQEAEEGGRVYEIFVRKGGRLELRFANGALHFGRIRPGDRVWRSDDVNTARAARPYLEAATPLQRQPITIEVTAHVGAPLQALFTLVAQPQLAVTARSPEALAAARLHGLDEATAAEQLGRLGGTPYVLDVLTLDAAGAPFAPVSLLNALRREAIEALAALQSAAPQRAIAAPAATLAALVESSGAAASAVQAGTATAARLHLLVRTPAQLEAALALRPAPASITLDYLELYGLRPSVEQVQAAGIEVRVASPRVLKPNEQRIVHFLLRLGAPLLVRSTGLVQALAASDEPLPPIDGDFSLNAANLIAARGFLDMGLRRLTPTHDLNAQQVAELAAALEPARCEAVAYQHLPVFHTEHCVFCRFLSTGTSYKDCGHPCETHRVALRDEQGRAHPVLADVGCRNTVFGAEAQEASAHLRLWLDAGLRDLRLEFAHETPEQLRAVCEAFSATLAGRIGSGELGARLAALAPEGSTQGSLFVPAGFAEIPLIL